MLIRVQYCDGTRGAIHQTHLDRMIEEGSISSFLRSTGWVQVGEEPIRRRTGDRRGRGKLVNIYV